MKLAIGATFFAAALVPMASHAADYATVISSTPVTAAVDVPRRVCTEEQQFVGARPSGAGAVIGAVAGGLLGNTIGAGFGRAAATGLGVVAGAAIGNNVEANAANAYPPTAVPVQRCQMVRSAETRTVGYDVVYEYAGQRYTTRMSRDPGPQFQVDVRPSGEVAAAAAPAPDYIDSPVSGAMYAPAPLVYGPPVAYGPSAVYGPPAVYIGPAIGYYGHYGYYGGWGYRGRHWR